MQKGKIGYLGKGFGFLNVPGREKDLWFHANELIGGTKFSDLKIGDVLQFEDITHTEKGSAATGVSFEQ